MATAALLDADFGSESEDDNFNPHQLMCQTTMLLVIVTLKVQ
jgi:hypothetical protein